MQLIRIGQSVLSPFSVLVLARPVCLVCDDLKKVQVDRYQFFLRVGFGVVFANRKNSMSTS